MKFDISFKYILNILALNQEGATLRSNYEQ